jgi:hypothetical protein
MIIRLALIFIALHLLFSCGAERLHQKAVNKGYVHNIYVDTFKVSTVDTMWIEGKPYPVTIYKDSLVPRLEIKYVPKWKVRFDNKRFNDSLKYIRKVYNDSLKAAIKMHDDSLDAAIKINKQDNKTVIKTRKRGPNLFFLGLAIGIILTLITRYAINQALKKFA